VQRDLQVEAAQLRVNKAVQEGVPLTADQQRGIVALAAARALGITAIDQQIDRLNIEAGTVG
jgi:hypothetical protein